MSRNMKDSGIAYIGEIGENFDVKPINSLFSIKKDIIGYEPDMVLSITQNGIKPKNINSNEGQIAASYANYQIVNIGDFAMNHMDLITGGVDISQYEGVTSPDYRVFTLNDKSMVDRYFLYIFQLYYKTRTFFGFGQGVANLGRWRLPASNFKNILVPITSIENQKSIVKVLDKKCSEVDSLIENQQKQIEKLKQYKQSLITEVITKGLNPNVELKDSGVEWIGEIPYDSKLIHLRHIVGIETGNMDTQNSIPDGKYPLYVRSPIIERCSTYTFEDDVAILMAGDGAGAGRIFHLVSGKYGCHQRVYRMNDFKYVIPKFLKYYLEVMFPIIMEQGSAKSTVDSVRLPMLKSFPVVVMDDNIQAKVVEFLDEKCGKIEKLIAIKQRKIEKLQQYKKSIIYEYVTGKKEAL